MLRRNLTFVLLALVCVFLLAAAAPSSARRGSSTAKPGAKPAAPRDQILLRINDERTKAGAPPLAPSAILDQVAQAEAEAIAARGTLPSAADFLKLQRQVIEAGYLAQGLTESNTVTVGSAADVIAYWKQDASYSEAMRHDVQDIGVGISEFSGVPLYTFLFAWPKSEVFTRQTAPLKDLQATREAMLALVNARRQEAGRPPLLLDPRLNEAAQKHAEDMLARVFYSHLTPEGVTAGTRVRAAGYPAELVAENIAANHTRVDEVMDAWMHSSGHKRNILDGRLVHIGIGIAVGSFEHRYQVVWVQDFSAPQPTVP